MNQKVCLSDTEKAELWKQRFFEAQAGMERFLVEKFGYWAIDDWIRHNAEVFASLQGNDCQNAGNLALRFAKQAECYKSEYVIGHSSKTMASLTITRCGIWEYRELARQKGVRLTFDNPCTRYCSKLIKSMA